MVAVILAGGRGTRLSEETEYKPKPMLEIGGKPILWHIMKIYSAHGINDFVICVGYMGHVIKDYFKNYFLYSSDVTLDIKNNQMEIHENSAEPWRVTLVDTGLNTQTGGRVKRVKKYLRNETFLMTYGDGVGDIDITALIKTHQEKKLLCTITATQPPGRFGALEINSGKVTSFKEKPVGDGSWINGGFFVAEPQVLDFIENDDTTWELGPLVELSKREQLAAYKHPGFWLPMDTLRDKKQLEELWKKDTAPWKTWKN